MELMKKVRERLNRWQFQWRVRAIARTPPIRQGRRQLIVLSMCHHRDVLPYVLAVKSFARCADPHRIVLVADPTLTDADQAIIRAHVPFIEIHRAEDFRAEGLPTGGTWERLSAISRFVSEGNYVIQLDADTVTIGPITDVIGHIESGTPFTLATDDWFQSLMTTTEVAKWAQTRITGNDHVQMLAEAAMDRIADPRIRLYARGCSGFAGFPARSFDPAFLARLAGEMRRLLGPRWDEWGSEQVASNLVVANLPAGLLLPHDKYCAPHRRKPQTEFYHFIGYVRFTTPLYGHLAQSIARELTA